MKRTTLVWLLVRRRTNYSHGQAHVVTLLTSRPAEIAAGYCVIPLRLAIDDAWLRPQAEVVDVDAGEPPEQPEVLAG